MSIFPDLTPLTNQITKFNTTQQQIIILLTEIKQIQTQVLIQLGGQIPPQLNSLNSTLKEE
jgi:hypothetical protein